MRAETRLHPRAILGTVRGRWRALFGRRALERDLADELAFHLDMETAKHLAAGMEPAAARRAALLALGGVDRTTESHRDARGTRWIEEVGADLRHALRVLARTPGFVAVSLATLTVAIGIGTVLFTAVNAFVNRSLPVPGGDELVKVFTTDYDGRAKRGASSYRDIIDFAEAATPVAEIAGEARVSLAVTAGDAAAMMHGGIVTPGYFTLLRMRPALGRFPSTGAGGAPAIVIGHSLWRRAFAGDSAAIGRQLDVNGHPFTVVAVAPVEFRGTSREIAGEFWLDAAHAALVMPRDEVLRERTARRWHVLARLAPGRTMGELEARLAVVAQRLFEREREAWIDASGGGRAVVVMLERDAHRAEIPRTQLVLLIGAVAAVGLGLMAIASANLAGMQLARGAARRREIATRLALGASRARLVRQLLVECAAVVVPGAVAGVAAAVVTMKLVSHYRPIPLPSIDLAIDWRAALFIGAALVMTVLVFGLLPALQSVRTDLLTDLKGGSQPGAKGLRVGGMRGGLIVSQVALSVLFAATSAMVAFALAAESARERGDTRNVVIARVTLLPGAGDSASVRALTHALVSDLGRLPGVTAASAADFVPVRGTRRTVSAEVRGEGSGARAVTLDANAVEPAYFDVLGLALLRGRNFSAQDDGGRAIVIVSRAMSEALWPGADPVGRHISIETRRGRAMAEVVGVVADRVGQPPATDESFPGLLYLPMRHDAESEMVLYVRAPGRQDAVAAQVMQRLRAEQARLAATDAMTLDRHHDRMLLPQRLLAQAAGVLALLQLLLAVAGLSGLVAYATALRRRELGIRGALGATRRSVLALVMRQALRLSAIGGAAGVLASLLVSRVVALSLPMPLTMVVAALATTTALFTLAALVGMVAPARRALAVAPAAALRLD